MLWGYRIALFLYRFAIGLAQFGNYKAKKWIQGRKQQKQKNADYLKQLLGKRPIWVHCASLGEFEQGRPVIEALRKKYPDIPLLLTFFSPSGYEIRKNYDKADIIIYLPLDHPRDSYHFIERYNPQLAIFVKYEFWYYYISCLYQRKIPVALISAHFTPHNFRGIQRFFFQKILPLYTHIFVQSDSDVKLLQKKIPNLPPVTQAGDTRFDRVTEIAANFQPVEGIREFVANRRCIVAGSVWASDIQLLLSYLETEKNICCILAPHEINTPEIQDLQKSSFDVVLYSEWQHHFANQPTDNLPQILVIDSIGLLSRLYYYATVVYIGGGFGKGIHNILEACVYGKPLFFGTNYKRFQEAVDLVAIQVACPVENQHQFDEKLNYYFNNPTHYHHICQQAIHYIQHRTGATTNILEWISQIIPYNQNKEINSGI